MELMKTKTSGK